MLLDTDILVDCLRGVAAARTWLESAASQTFGIPGIVAMELVVGCRNQAEQQRVQKFLTYGSGSCSGTGNPKIGEYLE